MPFPSPRLKKGEFRPHWGKVFEVCVRGKKKKKREREALRAERGLETRNRER